MLFSDLEGLILFFKRLIPLLLIDMFILTPFFLLPYIFYVRIGLEGAIIVGIFVLAILFFGLLDGEEARKNSEDTSLIVYTFIFSMYLLILLLIVWDMDWFKLTKDYTIEKMKTKSVSETVSHSSTTPTRSPASPNTKEGEELLFLKLLRDSTSNSYDTGVHEAMKELKEMDSKLLVPEAIKMLKNEYLKKTSSSYYYDIRMAKIFIGILVEMKAQEACSLLYEIRVKGNKDNLRKESRKAASQICVESPKNDFSPSPIPLPPDPPSSR